MHLCVYFASLLPSMPSRMTLPLTLHTPCVLHSQTTKNEGDNANGGPQEGSVVAQIENEQREQEKKAMLDDGGRTCTGVLASRPTSRCVI